MAQISLYVDDEKLDELRKEAAAQGISISKYVGQIIDDHYYASKWPPGFFSLYGSVTDETFVEPDDDSIDASLDDACEWFVGV